MTTAAAQAHPAPAPGGWTARDHEVLGALLHKARVFSLRQLAGHWWHGDLANTRRRLRRLVAARLLEPVVLQARALPEIAGPVASWQPGREPPNCGQVSYRLKSRWQGRPLRSVSAFLATERAAQLLGGKGRSALPHATQATHDLGVAAVWLALCRRAPHWAAAWRGEDLMAASRAGEKLPDAFLVDEQQRTFGLIEFGGAYAPERVQAFHEDCAFRELPYQIW